jgi:DNA-binding response OmpR family regulator
MSMPKILVIDDDKDLFPLYEKIINPLVKTNFLDNLEDGIKAIKTNTFDLILLDLYFLNDNSIDWLENDDEINPDNIILVTSNSNLDLEIKSHRLGLRDYLKKPFNINLSRAIIDKHLQKVLNQISDQKQFGPFIIDYLKHEVFIKSESELKDISLTNKEYALFKLLITNHDKVITRERIFDELYHEDKELNSRSVDMYISSLRKKMGLHADLLKTKRSLGYIIQLKNSL